MNSSHDRQPDSGINETNFESEVLHSSQPTLVVFWAPWSRPCQILDETLMEVAATYEGSAKIVKVNADDNPDLSLWYEVQSIPTQLFFLDGKLRAKVVGTASKEAIIARLQSILQRGDYPSSNAPASQ